MDLCLSRSIPPESSAGPRRRPRVFRTALALGAALLTLAPGAGVAAEPAPPRAPTPYDQGRVRVGLSGGGVGRSGQVDIYVSAAFGYFVVDNLELGADLTLWFGDTPFTAQLGPTLRYIIPLDGPVKPYLGAFYRHWFVSGPDPDADTLGGRAGVIIHSSSVFFSIGAAYEAVISACDAGCSSFYPEFGISFFL